MSDKKRVLVTGASSGIGMATAYKLAEQGFAVAVHYRSGKNAAEKVANDIVESGGEASTLQFDIADRDGTRTAIESDIEQFGAYYGVVCNAGVTKDTAFPAMTSEEWDGVVHTNLDGFYNVLHPTIMPMIRLRKGGRIVTLSSVSGQMGNRGQTNYSASKAGIIGATKALAMELGKRKITVNCVAPGVIETGMIEGAIADEAKKMIPLGTFGHVDDVANTIGFLVSDSAKYITRQVISVNGGMY
ncbi:3-oxoacyl-ACP reductase FabG [Aestuariibacter sp. A3R04]|uniref:3-oxoacyl-ACP reductase FabG n=1 Tax=Aestuariibacter sp. A3R04 TaxID=2841571 RepID=UPI001C0818AA|nr:3-oxoacyl-ACP reductase FabG [Aestuariibacter sp. A3R04]MBU3020489.1 3-oxoacyl-ACP reductase FabG [Aestuariibacter sp. A3R04]